MVDIHVLFRDFLKSTATANGIPALCTLVYAGDLPAGYNPVTDGPAITFFTRGGSAHEEAPIVMPSLQVKVWAEKGAYAKAFAVYRAIHDWAHGNTMVDLGASGMIMSCLESSQGQEVNDPDTGWATVVTFFDVMARS